MPIAIRSSSAAIDNFEQAFDLISQAGADGVEASYDNARSLEAWAEHAAELQALAAKHHLALPSLNLAFLRDTPSLIRMDEASIRARQAVRDALTVASAAGAGVVLLPFSGKNSIESETELDTAADLLSELVEGAEEVGVVLGIETTLNFSQQRYLMDRLGDPPCAKIYYDTADMQARKLDAATGIRDLGLSRIAQVHLKDVKLAEAKAPDYHVALGEGNVDFRAVASALAAIHYEGWVVLETPPGDDPLAEARRNMKFARELFGPANH
ncbi:MAG: sugar phosphate isomerase/epimerase family protein [Phycisphaerae bacterium]|jgi:sugar phosphate isomerase/epimerase